MAAQDARHLVDSIEAVDPWITDYFESYVRETQVLGGQGRGQVGETEDAVPAEPAQLRRELACEFLGSSDAPGVVTD